MIRIIVIVPLSEATVVFGVIVRTFLVFTLYFVVVVSEGPVFGFVATEVVPIFRVDSLSFVVFPSFVVADRVVLPLNILTLFQLRCNLKTYSLHIRCNIRNKHSKVLFVLKIIFMKNGQRFAYEFNEYLVTFKQCCVLFTASRPTFSTHCINVLQTLSHRFYRQYIESE